MCLYGYSLRRQASQRHVLWQTFGRQILTNKGSQRVIDMLDIEHDVPFLQGS